MMRQEDVPLTLEDAPDSDFTGSKLQIKSEVKNTNATDDSLLNGNVPDTASPTKQEQSYSTTATHKARPNTLAVVPWSGENARDFFSYRDGLVTSAVQDCLNSIVTSEDGDHVGHWLLTEISFWDHEKERLVLLTTKSLFVVKYDFIALRELDHRKVPLEMIDTVIIGELSYPAASLIPSRKMSGVRALWNNGEPLPFLKKWNPFEKEIPFATFASHPLLWHKDGTDGERRVYNVDDFTSQLTYCLEWKQRNLQMSIQHRPILLENYIGLSSLIHNKNSLGFFKVRGKFSF